MTLQQLCIKTPDLLVHNYKFKKYPVLFHSISLLNWCKLKVKVLAFGLSFTYFRVLGKTLTEIFCPHFTCYTSSMYYFYYVLVFHFQNVRNERKRVSRTWKNAYLSIGTSKAASSSLYFAMSATFCLRSVPWQNIGSLPVLYEIQFKASPTFQKKYIKVSVGKNQEQVLTRGQFNVFLE